MFISLTAADSPYTLAGGIYGQVTQQVLIRTSGAVTINLPYFDNTPASFPGDLTIESISGTATVNSGTSSDSPAVANLFLDSAVQTKTVTIDTSKTFRPGSPGFIITK